MQAPKVTNMCVFIMPSLIVALIYSSLPLFLEGVNVMAGCHVENVKYENKKDVLSLNSGKKVENV